MRPVLLLGLAACAPSYPSFPADAPADRCAAGALPAGPSVFAIRQGERNRSALVFAPPGPGPHDVVVLMHEYRAEPLRHTHYTGWEAFRAESNAIVVAPDGRAATWNAGSCCGKAFEEKMDDIAFLNEVVARVESVGCTTGRVLASGIGNGAMMAQHWACNSEVPDGVVSVGGALQVPDCPQPRPIPLLHYHGADDTFFPASGLGGQVRAKITPVDDALTIWAKRNGAAPAAPREAGPLSCRTWTGQAPIVACMVTGMRDLWPGAADAKLTTPDPLGDATRGGWAWMQEAWAATPTPPPPSEVPSIPAP